MQTYGSQPNLKLNILGVLTKLSMVPCVDCETRCSACGKTASSIVDHKCLSCDQPLEVHLHIDFDEENIQRNNCTMWRYGRFFPYAEQANIVTLGEGWTPLVQFQSNVHFKLENLNPTGSFKDRGSSALISALHNIIRDRGGYISEDSSGNAGASMAAYAARAGLKARVYVPHNVSGPKLGQIQFYGAEVARVPGSRNKVAEAAQKPEIGKFYVGHIFHPLFRDGIRSLAYEIAENFAWEPPDLVYLPVSAGSLLLGIISGFTHLVNSSMIESMPKIIACQTRQVSPLYHRIKNEKYAPPETVTSIADALVSVNPPLLDLMVKELMTAKGDAVVVEENETLNAFKELAGKGFFVEPSSAVAYAAYKKQIEKEETSKGNRTVIVLTGTGLKTALSPT